MSAPPRLLVLLLALLSVGTARAQNGAAPDSVRRGGLLEELQRRDFEIFPADILQVDAAHGDSLVTELQELGLDGYEELADRRSRRFDWDLELGTHLANFNRVEGFLPAAALEIRPFGPRQLGLRSEAGWAFASEELRHLSELELPWIGRKHHSALTLSYGDRVQAFGSNRPFANSLRGLVGGADEQDYLRRRGGGVELSWSRDRARVALGYAAFRETSVDAATDFALMRELGAGNPAVDEGIDRSLVVALRFGRSTFEHFRAGLQHRVSGGGLGGDFVYTRSALEVEARRFLQRFEFNTRLRYVRTGGSPTVQQLADVGGITSVHGYPRRSLVGKSSVDGRLEMLVPYDLLRRTRIPLLRSTRLQFVPFADAARVFDGDSDRWIHSAGLGIQRFLGAFGRASNLRLELAAPIGPDRPTDFHVTLSFSPGIL